MTVISGSKSDEGRSVSSLDIPNSSDHESTTTQSSSRRKRFFNSIRKSASKLRRSKSKEKLGKKSKDDYRYLSQPNIPVSTNEVVNGERVRSLYISPDKVTNQDLDVILAAAAERPQERKNISRENSLKQKNIFRQSSSASEFHHVYDASFMEKESEVDSGITLDSVSNNCVFFCYNIHARLLPPLSMACQIMIIYQPFLC